MAERTPIDFVALAAALLQRADALVSQWLPGGVERNGRWYVGDFDGGAGESANVNLSTGQWIDNAAPDQDKGGDLISLYARVRGLNNGQAARELMRDMGWSMPESTPRAGWKSPAPAAEPPADAAAAAPPPSASRSPWRAIVPVPPFAPAAQFRFGFKDQKRGVYVQLDAVRTWEYRRDDALFGYVARFERVSSDGEVVKDTIPLTWCVDTADERGSQRWHWKSWEAPRPLYLAAGTLRAGGVPVLLVEGEKCAQAAHALLGDEFDCVSWPGGCKAWPMADWSWLKGRTVVMWPDADAQRSRLTREEREGGVDPATKPLLPEHKQPGMAAMVHIGTVLVAEHGCEVSLCVLPAPGSVAAGWDVADAIDAGWGVEQLVAFIDAARPFVPVTPEARARADAGRSTPTSAGASQEVDSSAWRARLLETEKGGVRACRENVVLALDGMELPDGAGRAPGIAQAAGVVGYNEFTNDVMKLKPAPWGSPAGVWEEVDELLMGEWLVREHYLPSMPRGTLEEAVRMVAFRHRFHPVREYLAGLKWDGTPRLATWLRRAVLEEDEFDDSTPLMRYLARAGTWFLQGMVARAMNPGVKFDYMLILEGAQGLRKSTLLATLAGEWFADTGLVLGEKDSYQQLQGRWLYEFPELDAFSKADVTKIKAFIASVSDYFRASFDKRARDYPRQLVFGGSTNEDHYLTDPTGNRRFWPVRVTRTIDIDWVKANRDQLFAEAVERVNRGARMYPTPEEELELFVPQQNRRAVENAIESSIAAWLNEDEAGQLVSEISLVKLLGKIGIGIEKLGPGRFHEKQAAAALRRMGWSEGRSSLPGRPRVYRRPTYPVKLPPGVPAAADSSTGHRPGHAEDEDLHGCPF